jgi:hypothetical protein
LAASSLGLLEPQEEIALRAHLDGCEDCRDELAELMAIASALPRADLSHVVGTQPQPAFDLGERVRGTLARERDTHRRRTRVRSIAAFAVAAAIAIVLTFSVFARSSSTAGRHVALVGSRGVTATATLTARHEGTQVKFHVNGLHDGDVYWLWLTDASGQRMAAGTFRGTDTRSDLVMTAGISERDVRRVWVTDTANRVVLDSQL